MVSKLSFNVPTYAYNWFNLERIDIFHNKHWLTDPLSVLSLNWTERGDRVEKVSTKRRKVYWEALQRKESITVEGSLNFGHNNSYWTRETYSNIWIIEYLYIIIFDIVFLIYPILYLQQWNEPVEFSDVYIKCIHM